ncbi:PP2C family protein-serine/threonine phosphatase [Persephonella sp.]
MDKGLRDYQQDCIYIDGEIFQKENMKCPQVRKIGKSSAIFAVCDGMGGLSEGEKASEFVCRTLKSCDVPFSKDGIYRMLFKIQKKFESSGFIWSGTTIAGVYMDGTNSLIFNAGDSRVYKYTPEKLIYLSHDHSYVQSLVDRGIISYQESFFHPERYIVEFGIGDVFSPDWNEGKKPFIIEDRLNEEELYLICTDGLSDYIPDQQIHYLLSPDPLKNFKKLIDELDKVKSDNYSVILVKTC